jgi:hypothetical protein
MTHCELLSDKFEDHRFTYGLKHSSLLCRSVNYLAINFYLISLCLQCKEIKIDSKYEIERLIDKKQSIKIFPNLKKAREDEKG